MRAVATAVGVVLAVGQLVVAPGSGAHPATRPALGPAQRPDAVTAGAAARSLGRPVEVLDRRTGRERTFANPDGSWTLEQNVQPVRVRRQDGSWTAIDPTLRVDGGAIRPRATAADVRFSAGGAGPFARMRTDAGEFTLSWPGELAAPRLSGDTAVYPDVLPGVDLAVRATVDGFTHVLVVKDRPAAANPALRRIPLRVTGLDLRSGPDGRMSGVNRAGTVGLQVDEALMWDSTGAPVRASKAAPAAEVAAAAPGERARRARVGVRTSGTDLVLEPDPALLADPGTVFPLYIDPSYSRGLKRFAYANGNNETNDTSSARVGRSPDSGALYRSYFTFDVAGLRGTRILDAELRTLLLHSWSCTPTPVNLYRVGGHAAGRQTWTGPPLLAHIDERSGNAHKPSGGPGCHNDPQPNLPMEFTGRLLTEIQAAADANWTEFPVGFSALRDGAGEATEAWWKRFSLSATTLVVVYNSRPGVPASPSADGTGCTTGTGRPFVSSPRPVLRGVVRDPDGETDLRFGVEWQRWNNTVNPPAWQPAGSGQQTGLRSDATGQVSIGADLLHGQTYRWHGRTLDPYAYGPYNGIDGSAWTAWCEFTVDLQGPTVAPGVSSTVYGADPSQVYGGVGRTAEFTFTANGVADVASYRWGWADPPTTTVAAPSLGGTLTLPLTPPPPKPQDPTSGGSMALYVVSVDRAGRSSPLQTYGFNLGSASAPVGRWEMAEPSGATSLADSSGGGRHATLTGGQPGSQSRLLDGPTALTMDGVDDYAAIGSVPVDTSGSFTVAAWVRTTGTPTGYRAVVTASGDRASSFFLRRGAGKWSFGATQSDIDFSPHVNIYSTATTKAGMWSHLVGVYDSGAKQIRLYVDGVLNASAPVPGVFRATRTIEFGRTKWAGNINYEPLWQGSVADVRIWDRVVSTEELAPMGATLAGRWRLDSDGTDATSFGRTATGPPSVSWVDDRDFVPGAALALDGTSQWLATSGPALRTNQSFTVAAWVKLDESPNRWANVLGQDGVNVSAFYLGHRFTGVAGEWGFLLKDTDALATGTWAYAQVPLDPETFGRWVHLTGVFDAAAGQARLYVDGTLRETVTRTGAWQAGGGLTIGRTWYPVQPQAVPGPDQLWPGSIDDVRVYQGVLPNSEIAKLAGL